MLPASALRWDVLLDHCDTSTCHQHFVASFYGVDHGTFQALDHEYPSHLEVHLTATDSQGLSSTTVTTLYPFTERLEVDSNPPGLIVTNQSASGPSPLVQTVIRGATVLVGVDSPQASVGASYQFASWSDGGLQGHSVNIFADTVVTATLHVAQPAVSIGATSVLEGPAASLSFPLTLSGPSAIPVSVGVSTVNGTAIAGTDYTSTSGTVTFAAGQTSATFTVPVIDNSIHQPDRTLSAVLGNPVATTIGTASAAGTILDDETADVSVLDAKPVLEGAPGATNPMKFVISLDRPSPVPVTFTATATAGTATQGKDFSHKAQSLQINAGATTAHMTVKLVGDSLYEPNETLSVVLSNVVGARVARAAGIGTIIDDDIAPSISVDDGTGIVSHGVTELEFTIHLSARSGKTAQITAAPSDGTAVAGVDYIDRNKIFTIDAGKTAEHFKVKVRRPGTGRTVFANLTNPSNVTVLRGQALGVC